MKDGDYFLVMGKKGESLFDYVEKAGRKIKKLLPSNLLKP